MAHRTKDPYLDAGMEGFIRNLAHKEYWRVANWYGEKGCGVEDLIQDGYLCYCKCRARYVDKLGVMPKDPAPGDKKWMMELVRTAFTRHIQHTVAGKMKLGHEEPISQFASADNPAADPWEKILPPQDEEASLLALLRSMPGELQQLVTLLVGDGVEALGFERSRLERRVLPSGSVRVQRRGRRRLRETTNQYYCRLLGLDPSKRDLRAQLVTYLRDGYTENI